MITKFMLVIFMTILTIGLISSTSAESCDDTDGGIDEFTFGTCTSTYHEQPYTYEDKCQRIGDGSVKLYERYCDTLVNGTEEFPVCNIEYIECENGCEDGACIKSRGRGDDPEPAYEPEITSGCFGDIYCSDYSFSGCPFQIGCSLHIDYFPFSLSCVGHFDCSDYIEPRCKFSEDYGCEWIEPNNWM
jgi:hypothetical protein